MKKLLSMVLCLLLLSSVFVACGKVDTDKGDLIESNAKLVVWDDERSSKYMANLIEEFKAEYKDYNVDVVYNMKDSGNTPGDLETAGPAGKGGDVVSVNHDGLGTLVKQKLIFPNDIYKEKTIVLQTEGAISAATYDGTLYGYPIGSEAPVLFYNKTLFAGQEDKLKTFDGLYEFSKARFDATPAGQLIPNFGFNFNTGYGNSFWLYGMFAGFGGYAFGDNNTNTSDIGLNNAESIEAAKYYRKWYQYHPQGVDASGTQIHTMVTMFKNKNLAAFYASPADYATLTTDLSDGQIKRDEIGVMELPTLPGGKKFAALTTYKLYAVNAYTSYPKAARAFAAFTQSKKMQVLRYSITGTLPTNKEAGQDPILQYDPTVIASLESLKNTTITPAIPEWNATYWSNMVAALNELVTSPAKPEQEIMNKCVEDMKKAIAEMNSST